MSTDLWVYHCFQHSQDSIGRMALSSSASDDWFFVGLASSFPNITDSSEKYFKLAWPQSCSSYTSSSHDPHAKVPGCKVFHPKSTTAEATPGTSSPTTTTTVEEINIDNAPGEDAWLMREQVLVFQYKGSFHAVDHACPHRTYSLSWGQPFDIEDAGRVVGRGLRCRGHGYDFELSTGTGDRGEYRLGVWDVQLRACGGDAGEGEGQADFGADEREREIWIRRRCSIESKKDMGN